MNTLLLSDQYARMLANGKANAERIAEYGNTQDFWSVVKLFCPWGAATWLLSELDPEDEDTAFGLCDLGFGCSALGSVDLSVLAAVRGPAGLTIKLNRHFKPTKSLTAHAREVLLNKRPRAKPKPFRVTQHIA